MDWSGQGYLTHSVELTTADGTVYRRIVNSDVGMDALSQLNAQAVSHAYGVGDYYQYGFYDTQGNYGEGQYYYGYAEQQVAYYKNIENITLNGTDYNDLFNYEGTGIGQFKGNGGTDTLYADLSGWTVDVHFINGATAAVNDSVNSLTVEGVERLLLQTGSGDDLLDNTANNTNDEILTGSGNDTVKAGGGNDRIETGAGDDLIILSGNSGDDTIDGGAGIDTLEIDWRNQGLPHPFSRVEDGGWHSVSPYCQQ
ncbi:MAG: hypothetical protein IPL02_01320 [Moraxellaceae bacterium]|nr:hypothetical protein [Moraxellaceae bacterium]